MKRILLLSLLLSLSSGCMWGRVQMNDPSIRERASQIRVGVTRADELRAILHAEPMMRMPLKDRTVMSYTYSDSKSNGLMLIAFNFMKTQVVTDTIYVETDAQGIVRRLSVPPARDVSWEFWPF